MVLRGGDISREQIISSRLTVYIVAYDISHNGRRLAVATLLGSFGERIQKSVFLLRLTSIEFVHVIAGLEKIAVSSDDSIYVVPLCAACQDKVVIIGQTTIPSEDLCWMG